ncbi:MAG: GNAT family N-acetyltransferase [Pseudomonadota bacterium]
MADDFILARGFEPTHRWAIAHLYYAAFQGKIGWILGPTGASFLANALDPAFAITALSEDRTRVLGIAGLKTYRGSLTGGLERGMSQHYGIFGALWRMAVLSLLERREAANRMILDGIAVAPAARGLGVGTALLSAAMAEAAARGLVEVRLDVIDSNVRARALYERRGFEAVRTERLGLLRHVFGFEASTTMRRPVRPGDIAHRANLSFLGEGA